MIVCINELINWVKNLHVIRRRNTNPSWAGIAQSVEHRSGLTLWGSSSRIDPNFALHQWLLTGILEENSSTVVLPRLPTLAWNPEEISPEVQNRGISGTTKRTCDLQKFNKNSISEKPSQFKAEADLIESIFANYNKHAWPVWNTTKTVDVHLRLTVTNILGIVGIVSLLHTKP